MGSTQSREGKHVHLYAACWVTLAFMVTGCLHWPHQRLGQRHLARARQHLADSRYEAALEENRTVLARFPFGLADQALFQIGRVYAHPQNPNVNYQKSLAAFQQMIDRYPASPLYADAELWMLMIRRIIDQENQIQRLNEKTAPLEKALKSHQRKIMQLQTQLEKLKRVDIKIEEQKREAIPVAEEIKVKENGKNSGR